MGTASSVQPKHGVLPNPRAVYTDKLSKKNKKDLVIDTPVLIDMKHGSIRYRYPADEKGSKMIPKNKEKPFEGDEKKNKGHYFYHTRLKDFSEKASVDREEPHKFLYVMKGPKSAKDKKVFYMFGKGFGAKDGQVTRPTASRAMGTDPNWPQRQNQYDVYYDLTFSELVPPDDPIPGIPNRYKMEFPMTSSDTVDDLKQKIARTIIKSSNNVHVCYNENELNRGDDIIIELRGEDERQMMFGVQVTLMPYGGQID